MNFVCLSAFSASEWNSMNSFFACVTCMRAVVEFLSIILKCIRPFCMLLFTTKLGFFELVSLTKHNYYSLTHTPSFCVFNIFRKIANYSMRNALHYLIITFVLFKMFEVCARVLVYIGLEIPQNIWIYIVSGCDFQVNHLVSYIHESAS